LYEQKKKKIPQKNKKKKKDNQSDANLRPLSAADPPHLDIEHLRFHCGRRRPFMAPAEPPKFQNFYFDAHPDQVFHSDAYPDPNNKMTRIHADPDP
jgi:hypothetical protein